MKSFKPSVALGALMVFAGLPMVGCASTPTQPGATKITVTFQDWQKFTDIKDRFNWTEAGEQGILKSLETALQRDARYDVPDGDHLDLVFTDIDLAGEYEPERGPNFEDVRIVKDIYPPRFAFTYTLTDAAGKVLKTGKENLTDMSFQMRISLNRDDPLHYEKDMLSDWMREKMHEK